jgi:hypothetical protein
MIMQLKSIGALAGVALFLWSATAPAQIYSAQCPIAGRYAVSGTNPNSAAVYHGQATITSNGVGCYVKWAPPNNSEGSGSYVNGVLTVHFALGNYTGVVQYTHMANGILSGTWWTDTAPNARGTETLYPIALAAPQ